MKDSDFISKIKRAENTAELKNVLSQEVQKVKPKDRGHLDSDTGWLSIRQFLKFTGPKGILALGEFLVELAQLGIRFSFNFQILSKLMEIRPELRQQEILVAFLKNLRDLKINVDRNISSTGNLIKLVGLLDGLDSAEKMGQFCDTTIKEIANYKVQIGSLFYGALLRKSLRSGNADMVRNCLIFIEDRFSKDPNLETNAKQNFAFQIAWMHSQTFIGNMPGAEVEFNKLRTKVSKDTNPDLLVEFLAITNLYARQFPKSFFAENLQYVTNKVGSIAQEFNVGLDKKIESKIKELPRLKESEGRQEPGLRTTNYGNLPSLAPVNTVARKVF
jgi:hypothetical protein